MAARAQDLVAKRGSLSLGSLSRRPPPARASQSSNAPPLVAERGPPLFAPGGAFYRFESAQARDLAVLAARVRRRELRADADADADADASSQARRGAHELRVLDVMCGSGSRGARYLAQAGATEVWSNDFNPSNLSTIAVNLAAGAAGAGGPSGAGGAGLLSNADDALLGADALLLASAAGDVERAGRRRLEQARVWQVPGLVAPVHEWRTTRRRRRRAGEMAAAAGATTHGREQEGKEKDEEEEEEVVARATCADAARLLAALSLRAGADKAGGQAGGALFQLVDLDSFGSADTHLVGLALGAVAYGGLLFLTSTDGFVSSGKRPERALASYGAWTRTVPGAPEQGLRALIGHAAREAAAQGLSAEPVFSYYSYHGPVFRAMLRITRGGNGRRRRTEGKRLQSEDGAAEDGEAEDGAEEDGAAAEGGREAAAAAAAAAERRRRSHAQRAFNSDLYGFVGYCRAHGETGPVAWDDLGRGARAFCPACARGSGGSGGSGGGNGDTSAAAELAGPMWLGPLHDGEFVAAMASEAERCGWIGAGADEQARHKEEAEGDAAAGSAAATTAAASASAERVRAAERDAKAFYTGRVSRNNPQLPLAELLAVMAEESDPRLPPLYFATDERLARRLTRCPPRDALIAALRRRGWAAARCQLERRALRTDAPLEEVLRVCEEEFEGCERRAPRV